MSTVALVREAVINGKRVRQTLKLGRGRRPNNLTAGSFYLRYLCPDKGKRVNQHAGYDFNAALAMREAKEREITALKQAMANGLTVERPDAANEQSRLKVTDAIDQYFRNLHALGKDQKTIRAYRKAIDQFRESCTKQYLDAIGKQDLIDFMGWLRAQPQRSQINANPGRTHFNKVNNVIIFLAAYGMRKILKKNEYPKFTEKAVVYFDDQQLKRLYASCMNEEEEFTLDCFLRLGVRDGEAAHAEYSDFRDRMYHIEDKPRWKWHPKKHHQRCIPVPDDIWENLQERRKRTSGPNLLFPNSAGKPNLHLLRDIQAIAERAGFHADLHTCRRTYATRLSRTLELQDIQRLLGHKEISTTMKYLGHVSLNSAKTRAAIARAFEGVR
jgi:integrase